MNLHCYYANGKLYLTLKWHSHCAPYGAAKQRLSALHRRRAALHGAVRRRGALNHYRLIRCKSCIMRAYGALL